MSTLRGHRVKELAGLGHLQVRLVHKRCLHVGADVDGVGLGASAGDDSNDILPKDKIHLKTMIFKLSEEQERLDWI